MKLITENNKSGITEYFKKSFNIVTKGGNAVKISVCRKIVNLRNPFVSKYYYEMTYNSFHIGDMYRKDRLRYYIDLVDKYPNRL